MEHLKPNEVGCYNCTRWRTGSKRCDFCVKFSQFKNIDTLNAELKEKGFMTISGRVNKQYFMERTCYGATKKERD